jgi:hypothetical protein
MTATKPSWLTHAYYRSTIVPLVREYCGYLTDNEAHAALKAAFYGLDPRGELPSMAAMDQETACRFLDFVIIEAAQLGLVLPDPRRKR